MSFKGNLILALAALAAVSTAHARDDFGIPQTANVAEYDFHGRNIDIVGFKPGMRSGDALELLKQRKKDVVITSSRIGSNSLRSEDFPSLYYSWEREKEEINVFMTSPSIGNEVFAVSRRLDFWSDETSPDYEATLVAFKEKYGEPSAVNDVLPDPKYVNKKGRSTTYMWFLGGEGKCDLTRFDTMMNSVSEVCSKTSHKTGPSVNGVIYTPARYESYQKLAQAGSDVVLVANVYNHDGSQRATAVTVSFVDLKRQALAAQEDVKLIQSEQAKFDSVKVAAPEL